MTEPTKPRVSDAILAEFKLRKVCVSSMEEALALDLRDARAKIKELKAQNGKLRDLDRLSTVIINGMDEMAAEAEADCVKSIQLENEVIALKNELSALKAQGPYRSAMLRCRDLAKSVYRARYDEFYEEMVYQYVKDLCTTIEAEANGDGEKADG